MKKFTSRSVDKKIFKTTPVTGKVVGRSTVACFFESKLTYCNNVITLTLDKKTLRK